MTAIINNVVKNSIADELELSKGDEIVSIDEIKPKDLIDYKYLISSEELSLHIKRANGEEEIIDIEKDEDEDLGINFDSAVFDKIIPCTNNCIFCFVDQQPDGLRNTLYIKDDDWRLSYLQGTYITLTNLSKKEKERIEVLRPGPLYISVHTTNPELRKFMLKNPRAGEIYDQLKWLNKLDIPCHVQIVLCPGVNDGVELENTLQDLYKIKSNIHSIAVVPVGITKYRKNAEFSSVDKVIAQKTISQIFSFNKKIGYSLAYAADEFYIQAEENFPSYDFYNEFAQLDDGVGCARMLIDDFKRRENKLPENISKPRNISIATGQIASKILSPIVERLNRIQNLNIEIITVKSNFWGENITVAGLITGQDLVNSINLTENKDSNIVIPSVMMRKYTEEFLDGYTLRRVQEEINSKITVIDNYYSTEELINFAIS